jgi:hypothetical protein
MTKSPPVKKRDGFREFRQNQPKVEQLSNRDCLLVPQSYGLFAYKEDLEKHGYSRIGTQGMGTCVGVWAEAELGFYVAHFDQDSNLEQILKLHMDLFKQYFQPEKTFRVNIEYLDLKQGLLGSLKNAFKAIVIEAKEAESPTTGDFYISTEDGKIHSKVKFTGEETHEKMFYRCRFTSPYIYRLRSNFLVPSVGYFNISV